MFGFRVPFNIHTYAAIMIVGSQITHIMKFFLRRNISIARDRAWDQTVASRGKGPEFWQPYVEEWEHPPSIHVDRNHRTFMTRWMKGPFGLFIVRNVLLSPFQFYPLIGIAVSAWFRALGTAQTLHRRYFESKKMTEQQTAIFVEERKWDYRIFGFTAALLEGLPIIGLLFTISNRIGAAMWAHDLEKRQHFVAEERSSGRFDFKKKD
jgi:hypothetical protein